MPPSLKSRLADVQAAWKANFAKRERRECDLAMLDKLIADVDGVRRVLERRIGALNVAERALVERADEWRRMLTRERAAVAAAKALPERTPERDWISEPGGRSNAYATLLHMSLLLPPAESLDLALLAEVIEAQAACEREMHERMPELREPWMVDNLATVVARLAACRAQWDEVVSAWSTGDARGRKKLLYELGALVVRRAEADRAATPVVARRPARLRHVASTLRLIGDQVRAVGGLSGADGDAVAELLSAADLAAAELEGQGARPRRHEELAGEVDRLLQQYRACAAGRERKSVDRMQLVQLASGAASAYLQVTDLCRADASTAHLALRRRALGLLVRLEDEVELVGLAQAGRQRQR